jgi:uncharacterized membrane protein
MLIELTDHLPVSFGFLQEMVHSPTTVADVARAALRWFHFVAGITWIGFLYFFNLVNVPLQKGMDAETKKKVNPELLSRTLWFFRWGAVVTVLAGITYYAMYIIPAEGGVAAANLTPGQRMGALGIWLAIVLVTYAIIYALYNVPALTKDGRILAVVIAIVVIAMSCVIVYILGNMGDERAGKYLGNKTLSIGVGGGLGVIMLLNVWGVIWRVQKRVIASLKDGSPAPPPEDMRKAFLASRTNAWLSLPMLFFMGTSHGDWILFGK